MRRIILIAALAVVPMVSAIADVEELRNDGFTSGEAVTFQAGFVPGEIAAARFIPQINCPCVVTSVSLLFGGSSATRDMGLQIWEDAAGGDAPGTLLFTGTTTLTGSNVFLQEIDLSLSPIIVNGPFRVGLEFAHAGLPAVATDLDGDIDAANNFILADIGVPFWFRSATLGVSGDFVIRATVDNLVAPDGDGDGVADSVDNCVAIANSDQRDTDGDLIGNICDPDLAVPNDCVVNFLDLSAFSTAFLSVGAGLDADLNGDEVVNFLDLPIFVQYFLGPPGPSASGCN